MNGKIILILSLVMIALGVTFAHAEKMYRWVDERGVLNVTNDSTTIPDKYRAQAMNPEAKIAPQAQSAPGSPAEPAPPGKDSPQKLFDRIEKRLKALEQKGTPFKKAEGPRTSRDTIGMVFWSLGALVTTVGWIMLLISAAPLGFVWFIAILCCPCGPIFLAVSHWELAKKGFLVWMAGTVISLLYFFF